MSQAAKIDREQVGQLYGGGLGIRKIAALLGVSDTAVYKHVKALGIADRSRIPLQTVDKGKVCQLYRNGWGYRRIALFLGCSERVIGRYISRVGLIDQGRINLKKEVSRRQRRHRDREFSNQTKSDRFLAENGICQECRSLIEGGWQKATFHHIVPMAAGGDGSSANCMVLHPACHMDPDIFRRLHGHDLRYNVCEIIPRRPIAKKISHDDLRLCMQAGDSLSEIAKRYDVCPSGLRRRVLRMVAIYSHKRNGLSVYGFPPS